MQLCMLNQIFYWNSTHLQMLSKEKQFGKYLIKCVSYTTPNNKCRTGPTTIFRDSTSGALFESFSDQCVYFVSEMPSVMAHIKAEELRKMISRGCMKIWFFCFMRAEFSLLSCSIFRYEIFVNFGPSLLKKTKYPKLFPELCFLSIGQFSY